jgi:hypothetical protein
MIKDGPSPDSLHPPKGWSGVYRKTSNEAFKATLEANFEYEDNAITYAEIRSRMDTGQFLVVNSKGFTVAEFGKI